MSSSLGKHDRDIVIPLIVIAVLSTATISVLLTINLRLEPIPRFDSANHGVTIFLNGDAVGTIPGWNNTSPGPTLTVMSGETVHLLLNATDGLMHNWFIDTQNNSTPDPNGVSSPDFSLSTTRVLNFTFTPIIGQNIPSPGNWTYRCRYHPMPYMLGTIQILPSDFSLSASSTQMSTLPGSSTTTNIIATSGYSETVDMTSTSQTGLQISLGSTRLLIPGQTTLTVESSTTGNYSVTLTAGVGTFSHSLNITVHVTDFTISTIASTIQAKTNAPANSTITINSINHFPGPVTFSTDNSHCTISPTEATPVENASVSCTFPMPGTYSVTVKAMFGHVTRSSTLTYNVTGTQSSPTSLSALLPVLIAAGAAVVLVALAGIFLYNRGRKGL